MTTEELQGISVVDTQGLNTLESQECIEKNRSFIQKSDVLFVVFDALRIRSFHVCDFKALMPRFFLLLHASIIKNIRKIEKQRICSGGHRSAVIYWKLPGWSADVCRADLCL